MKIETKKNIGDVIFFLKDGKIISSLIENVNSRTNKENSTEVSYMVKVDNPKSFGNYDFKTVNESEAFDSREQLIESL